MSCATFTKAIRSLIPGVFQENINCTVVDLIDVGAVNTSVGLESEAVVNSDSMLAVDVFTVTNASYAVVSYLNNMTDNGQLATSLQSYLNTSALSLSLRYISSPKITSPINCEYNAMNSSVIVVVNSSSIEGCTAIKNCPSRQVSYVPEYSCCAMCESIIDYNYLLDFGIYLLRVRQYTVDLAQWQQGRISRLEQRVACICGLCVGLSSLLVFHFYLLLFYC